MGRNRSVHLNLPTRMKARVRSSGTYFYYFTGDKELPLGKDYVEAVRLWAEYEGGNAKAAAGAATTFKQICVKYLASATFKAKAPRTQKDYLHDTKKLYEYFDNPPAPLDSIKPSTIAAYRDWRKVTHSTQELALFSAVWNFAREAGLTDLANPATKVTRNRAVGRDVYIEDELFKRVYDQADQPTQDAMDLAYLAAQRPGDSLRFKEADVKDGALWVRQGKTGKRLRVALVGKLKVVYDRIMARKSTYKVRSLALVVNEQGMPLTPSALDGRFGKARLAAGVGTMEFQFRDLRAKAATEIDDASDIATAQQLLGHSSASMTRKYVRNRRGKLVQPAG